MPRLSKIEEISKWLKGAQMYLFEVKYPYMTFQVGVYANSEKEAISKLAAQYTIDQDIKPVFGINRIIY